MAGPTSSAAPAKSDLDKIIEGWDNAPAQGSAPKAPTATGSDPYENLVNWGAENLVPEGTPDWARTVGRFVIPQNTPELALAALLGPVGKVGGMAAKAGLPGAVWMAKKTVPSFLARTGLTAAGTSVAGAATGHDPTESAAMGAIGNVAGEAIGGLTKKIVQSKVVTRLYGEMTSGLSEGFRTLIGKWLPEGATDARVLQDVIADGPSKRVGAEIEKLKAKHASTGVNVIDLVPELDANGVSYAWPRAARDFESKLGAGTPGASGSGAASAGKTGGKTGTAAGPGTADAGIAWPPVRDFEYKLQPGEGIDVYGAVEKGGPKLPPGGTGPKQLGEGEAGGKVSKIYPPEPKRLGTGGDVPYGALDAQIAAQKKAVENALAKARDEDAIVALTNRLNALEALEAKVSARVDPEMKNLLSEYAKTKQLRDLMWGTERAAHSKGEKVLDTLIDPKTGHLSEEGVKVLQQRLLANAPRLGSFDEAQTNVLLDAMHLDLGQGAQSAVAGQGLKALIPGISWFGGRPHPYWHGKPPMPGSMPGWEGAQTTWESLKPYLYKMLGGGAAAKGARETGALSPAPATAGDSQDVSMGIIKRGNAPAEPDDFYRRRKKESE